VKRPGDEEIFLRAVAREAGERRGAVGPLKTLYIGGGTPTALSVEAWAGLIKTLDGAFELTQGAEVTVEANPGSLSVRHLELWRGWRVNRISLGVQSFDDRELKFLGRAHSSSLAVGAVRLCASYGFDLSLDLMFGLPDSDLRNWACSLRRAVSLAPGHISVYQLSIEPGTPFAEENFSLPEGYRQYRYAQWFLPRKGYPQYEVASFALQGRESRHNLNYWADGDYIGVGPSAWSYIGGTRSKNEPNLREYESMIFERKSAAVFEERLGPGQSARQAAVLALRVMRGIDWRAFEKKHGSALADGIKKNLQKFPPSLVRINDESASLTPRGLRVANRIWEEII
jgi:oxygen-independent coproporphyrinogen-3 oxidase